MRAVAAAAPPGHSAVEWLQRRRHPCCNAVAAWALSPRRSPSWGGGCGWRRPRRVTTLPCRQAVSRHVATCRDMLQHAATWCDMLHYGGDSVLASPTRPALHRAACLSLQATLRCPRAGSPRRSRRSTRTATASSTSRNTSASSAASRSRQSRLRAQATSNAKKHNNIRKSFPCAPLGDATAPVVHRTARSTAHTFHADPRWAFAVGPVGPALPRWAEPAASLLVHPYLRACAAERIGRCRRMRVRRRARARWRLAGPPSLSAPCFLWPHAVVVRGSRAGRAGVGGCPETMRTSGRSGAAWNRLFEGCLLC